MNISLAQYNVNPSFGAQIVQSKYLEKGKRYALKDASIEEKYNFYRALEVIKNDKEHDTFLIRGVPKSNTAPIDKPRDWMVIIDGKTVYSGPGIPTGSITDGSQALRNTVDFVKENYGYEKMDKYTKECVNDYHQLGEQYKELGKSKKKRHSAEFHRLQEEYQAAHDFANAYLNYKIKEILDEKNTEVIWK